MESLARARGSRAAPLLKLAQPIGQFGVLFAMAGQKSQGRLRKGDVDQGPHEPRRLEAD